jgi:hypothetical protein
MKTIQSMIIAVSLLVFSAFSVKAQQLTYGVDPAGNIDSTSADLTAWYSDISGAIDSAKIDIIVDTNGTNFLYDPIYIRVVGIGSSSTVTTTVTGLPRGTQCKFKAAFYFFDSTAMSLAEMLPGNALSFTTLGQNPVPVLNSISPATVVVGANSQQLSVSGSDLTSTSVIWLNGSQRPTVYVSSTSLTYQLSQTDQAFVGTYSVEVRTPTPGGGISGTVDFTVIPQNPAPIVNGVSPSSVQTGSESTTFLIDVAGFLQTTTLTVIGNAHAYTLLNPSTVELTLEASYLDTAGTVTLVFTNPGPGGGSVTATISVIDPNPVPVLNSFSPDTVLLGAGNTLFEALADYLLVNSVIRIGAGNNVTEIAPDYMNLTNGIMQGLLPAHLFDTVGVFPVRVWNPSPGGGLSNAINLVVVAEQVVQNPVPQLTAINPDSVEAGTGDFLMTLTFSANARLVQGGTIRFGTINYLELVPDNINQLGTQAQVIVPAFLVEQAGNIAVKAWNPGPSGGLSNTLFLSVTEESVPVDTNRLVATVVSNITAHTAQVAGQLQAVENLQVFCRMTENIVSGPNYETTPEDYTLGTYSLGYSWTGLSAGTTYYVQIVGVNIQGEFFESNWKTFQTLQSPNGIEEIFTGSQQFDRLELYDIDGRPVMVVEHREDLVNVPAGMYTYRIWNDTNLVASGIWNKGN